MRDINSRRRVFYVLDFGHEMHNNHTLEQKKLNHLKFLWIKKKCQVSDTKPSVISTLIRRTVL